MRFTRVRVENFKCYADASLRLDRGVTVIHGLNGSGKSSLLEACFFALYGSKATDETLDDVVSIGADGAVVELWFTHAGEEYHVERRVSVREDRAVTTKAVLETPSETFEGARAVRARITELLRMDEDAFVNCAYVRQGEVNKLINADPADRQDVLDDLLQLGKLEDYRERASDARVGVKRVRDGKRDVLENLDEQIAAKEDADLHDQLNHLESELAETVAEIERLEVQRETAVETRDEAAAVLDAYEEKREELDDLAASIDEVSSKIAETEREREALSEEITSKRESLDETRDRLEDAVAEAELDAADVDAVETALEDVAAADDELQEAIREASVEAQEHDSTAESLGEQAAELTERASEGRERADELAASVEEARTDVADHRERLDDLDEEIASTEATFEGAPATTDDADAHRESVAAELEEVRQTVTELETTIEGERESLAEAERLREQGKCPECGQDVDGSPHVESIEADRERIADLESELAGAKSERDRLEAKLETAESLVAAANELDRLRDKRESVTQLLEEKESGLDDDVETVAELRAEADELDERAAAKREEAAAAEERAEERRSDVAEYNQERQALRERRDRLEGISGLIDGVESLEDDLDRLRERRENKAEVNDERRERLADLREERAELEASVDEARIEAAREDRERAADYVERADDKLDELSETRADLQSRIGGVENEIEELESLRERRAELATVVEHLESLYDEADDLQRMYGNLRADLRQRNVDILERMVNETFDLIYQNDSYARIELDGEYQLTVYQKDGEPLDPQQLSGGERALFNLSLRCAIYRLLAEGIEGAAPMPPLILDEPTVFLDAGHVTKLLDLIEYMRDEVGVEQIIVVSHDDELVGAADALVRVEKDATSNRSSVERVEAGVVAELAD